MCKIETAKQLKKLKKEVDDELSFVSLASNYVIELSSPAKVSSSQLVEESTNDGSQTNKDIVSVQVATFYIIFFNVNILYVKYYYFCSILPYISVYIDLDGYHYHFKAL